MKLVAFRNFSMIVGLAFLVLAGGLYEARAQGRGRNSNWDKKCEKFVNCHDASEGRVDGRGPRRGNNSNNWDWRHSRRDRDRDRFDNNHRRRHHRDRDNDRNNHRRHRDGDRWNRRGR